MYPCFQIVCLTSKMSERLDHPASRPRSLTNVDCGTSKAPETESVVLGVRKTYLQGVRRSNCPKRAWVVHKKQRAGGRGGVFCWMKCCPCRVYGFPLENRS